MLLHKPTIQEFNIIYRSIFHIPNVKKLTIKECIIKCVKSSHELQNIACLIHDKKWNDVTIAELAYNAGINIDNIICVNGLYIS